MSGKHAMAKTFVHFRQEQLANTGQGMGVAAIKRDLLALLARLDEIDEKLAAAHLQAALDCLGR